MKTINQLVYSIASIFAIVTACSAMPINVPSMDHASAVMIGLLAITCFSITILACTCCHRNKSGFEPSQIKDRKEFENENTIADQSNSVSEFPIFRAISPLNAGHTPNSALNNSENRILSNIVNQNQMNRTFNEFENNQNNNGPISVVDMENIQNNNAVDYIPNRNEINNTIDPLPHAIDRNLVDVNGDSGNSVNATSVIIEQSMPMLTASEYDSNIASGSNYNSYCQLNEFSEYCLDEPLTVSESLNNYIDLEDDSEPQTPAHDTPYRANTPDIKIQNPKLACPNVTSDQNSRSNTEINLSEDDAVSVEEALRALDFAISGGESIFSDYQDDTSSSDESENESEIIDMNRTVNAKDSFNKIDADLNAEIICDNRNNQHSREDVYEVAKELVDSVLDECMEKMSLMTHPTEEILSECKNMSENELIDAKQMNEMDYGLNDSMEETFVVGKLEASTPCHKTFINCQREKNEFRTNLFQTLDEVNESALDNDGIEPLQASQTQIGYATFEVQPNDTQLATTYIKDDDKTFIATNQPDLQETFNIESGECKPQLEVPTIIKIDKEEVNSDDLTTITPMNTPIELNYVGETWDQLVSKSMNKKSIKSHDKDDELPAPNSLTISKNSWFLHQPQTDDTFNINDADYSNYDGTDEDSESVEENPELLSLTFDALRKQLADVLPQSSVRPSVEYSDDEDNVSDSDPDCDNIEYHNKSENPRSEVYINYKQQLSPILEESEDETCKTFVLNETKCLDSTSTGCIETSEAIMGVTKILMASNDTLFNFEDTLGDREDMLSPRNLTGSGSAATPTTPQPDICKTPTNEAYHHVYPIEYKPNEINTFNENQISTEIRPNSLQLNFENLTNNLGDLLSPEQQKTFSEEINTIEQLSSDLSATIDATNTLDDLKTCISVHFNDDANSDRLDVSENDAIAIRAHNESHSFVERDDLSQKSIDIYQTQMPDTCQIADEQNSSDNDESVTKDKKFDLFALENIKENKNPNLDAVNSEEIKPEEKINHNHNQTFDMKQMSDKINCQPQPDAEQNHTDILHESVGQLSGEEDPWAAHPITDIRFLGPGFDDRMHQMTGTFGTNDCWDSDIEDSNSSEEFLYAKGTSQISEYLRSTNQNNSEQNELAKQSELSTELSTDEQINTQNIWNSHEDLIAVTTKIDTDDLLDESSISENETEWVPSSWDNLAKPARSALKSPDKSSSRTGTKNRRSVVFKKQNYQSVYEYPKESASFSPTMSEPSGWATYLSSSSPFSSSMNGTYENKSDDQTNDGKIDFNALDGFAVSSSSRPFHLTSTECHTWPTDSEFSWSQMQSDKEHANMNVNYPADSWPTNVDRNNGTNDTNDESRELKSPSSMHRPDSGVGESGDLSESFSLGDLCHTKSSLRLPLNVYTINSVANEKELIQSTTPADDQNESSKSISQNDYSENVVASESMDSIVPTSCTGSMDSINSFDGGKSSLIHLNNSTNTDGLLLINTTETKNVSHETPIHNDDININTNKKCDYKTTANRQSDSTDEDSGIENIVRVAKEV
ncbi:putative uncharacterized protein DDB_G0282133 isoform X2 [Contarinia nasturtii]|uniref:putative uncharacterized protein DDB_G0282133 isoform X2 n=1 Tax=Contarinia nasturtii TaxID=265458 RepID=UPI0012D40C57|nr:putative uncharacterized protein DDB_G0282133 isoform X2 [Contarinia nasturtii]